MPTSRQLPKFEIRLKTKVKPSQLFQIRSPEDAAKVARLAYENGSLEWKESFLVFGLSTANKVVGYYEVSTGAIGATLVDVRVVMQWAILANCVQIFLVHNHPSGTLEASREDENITKQIKSAAELFDIKVVDHIILTAESFYSFAQKGKL